MHAGDEPDVGGEPVAPSDEADPEVSTTPADTSTTTTEPGPPALPPAPANAPTSMAGARRGGTPYLSERERGRSVRRRANPLHRQLARGAIGLTLLAAMVIGLFFTARLVEDYLDRDRLPGQGADVPTIRATSFELRSAAPAPDLDGTLTLDTSTGAFEFSGRGAGSLAGVQAVSPDGVVSYTRIDDGNWQPATTSDPIIADITIAVEYLADDNNADDILTSQLRRGYVDLVERIEVGTGDNELRRYDLRLDTRSFEDDFPLQYAQFEADAIPGVPSVDGLLVTITLDDDDVLVGVEDSGSNWSWQRLAYTDQPFTPDDPTDTP